MILMFSSQMNFLCTSSCSKRQTNANTHHGESGHVCSRCWRLHLWALSHQFLIFNAILVFPELPLGQDRLVRVGEGLVGPPQQHQEQGRSRQEAGMTSCRRITEDRLEMNYDRMEFEDYSLIYNFINITSIFTLTSCVLYQKLHLCSV